MDSSCFRPCSKSYTEAVIYIFNTYNKEPKADTERGLCPQPPNTNYQLQHAFVMQKVALTYVCLQKGKAFPKFMHKSMYTD